MPFDLARLMPDIEEMATYYAGELEPDLIARSQRAWALIQRAEQEDLDEAAHRQTLRVLAKPLENPARTFPAPEPPPAYRILASDGSAVDPDPHFAARYAVLHVALAGLAYAPPGYWTQHDARFLFRREELEIEPPGATEPVAVEGPVIHTLRAYEELQVLWEGVQQAPSDPHGRPFLAMMDAIILWTHRGTGPGHNALKEDYLTRSVALLESFHQGGVPLVSFISMPRHREIVNTMLAQCCPEGRQLSCTDCRDPREPCAILRGIQDRDLFGFLPEGSRSALFQPIYQGDTAWRLPQAIRKRDPRLAFFYVNTGPEIGRLELPLWIVEAGLLDLIHGILIDQCRPLRAEVIGYPVALTMAHWEAILTTRDRQGIQWLVEDALARRQIFAAPSAKAQMKER